MADTPNPMQTGPRIAYVLGGNRYAPRAATVKLFTADGPKEMNVIAVGPLKRMIETIVEMAPARIEAYDASGKLLRSLDLTKLENPDGDGASDASTETTVHVTREERLLSHFANLLADGRKNADDMVGKAFRRLAEIAEHHASRANALEQRNASLQNALVKQASNLVQSQLAVAQAQAELRLQARAGGDGDEGDDAFAAYIRKVVGSMDDDDEPAAKPAANGAAEGSKPQ